MSIKGSAATLAQAAKDLSMEWQQTKNFWHDVKSQEFEKKYIDELPGQIARATAVMEDLHTLLGRVRSDCE
jgi:uncharacterized protein YeaO (DUF488 family)